MSVALEGFEPMVSGAGQAPAADPIKTVSMASFQNDVMVASTKLPVLAYFTATWCGPCKQLRPALEKTVRAYNGKVTLAKIDIDQNPQLAQMLQVQSVPMVFGFINGQPVDAFSGAVPESQIKLFIDRLLQMLGVDPDAEADDNQDDPFAPAMRAFGDGNMVQAMTGFQAILADDAKNARALAGLALTQSLAAIKPSSAEALQNELAQDARNFEVLFQYADALLAGGNIAGALDQLLESIRINRSWNEDAARLRLLQILELLGNDDELTQDARKRLSRILFS